MTKLFLLFALFLTGCATPNVQRDYSIADKSDKGVVFGSMTRTKSESGDEGVTAAASAIKFIYRQQGTDDRNFVELDSWMLASFYRGDFETIEGEVFVIELPPGKYEFFTWSLMQGSNVEVTPEENFSIPFEVSAGGAQYIGELNLDILFKKNWLGIGIVAGAKLSVKDSYERDMDVITSKYPNIDRSLINSVVLAPSGSAAKGERQL